MATHKVIVTICDGCKKENRYRDTPFFGGHPLSGWLEVHEHNGSTMLEELQKQRDFIFCSRECLIKHFN